MGFYAVFCTFTPKFEKSRDMDFSKLKGGFKTSTFWMNFFGITSFFIVLFFFFQIGLRLYTRHGQGIEVPDVKGILYAEAQHKLHDLDLEVLVVDSDYVKEQPAFTVLEQNPAPGMTVKKSRTIYLTINAASSPTLVLPDLADNSSKRQAMVRLKSMGLNLGPVETIDGEKDWVYAIKYKGQKIYAGDRIPSDATVVLVVGSGMVSEADDSTMHTRLDDQGAFSSDLDEDKTETAKSSDAKTKSDEWF